MSGGSKIEWCDATFNPWWGCERVSPACAHCYADTFARRLGMDDLWAKRGAHGFRFFGDKHWFEPLRWAQKLPAKLGRRPRVFCASMADVFEDHPELEAPRTRLFVDVIAATPELDWLVLTKRPEFAREWLGRFYADELPEEVPWPNVWLGVSIENARFSWRADLLREIPATVRFISAEPLLGSLFPETFECPRCEGQRYDRGSCALCANRGRLDDRGGRDRMPLDLTDIDWVIIGGESGPGARTFHLGHARELITAARLERGLRYDAGRHDHSPAVFVKQLGADPRYLDDLTIGPYKERQLVLRDRKGGDPSEWPTNLRIREYPHRVEPVSEELMESECR